MEWNDCMIDNEWWYRRIRVTMDVSVRNRIIATAVTGAALAGLAGGSLAWYDRIFAYPLPCV